MTRSTFSGARSAAAAFASLAVLRTAWLPALLVAAFWAAPSFAADRWQYCYAYACFDNLPAAEAAMKAAGQAHWQYAVLDDVTSVESNGVEYVTRTYRIEGQPPASVQTPHYYSNGSA